MFVLSVFTPATVALTIGKTFFKPRATGQDAVLTQALNISFLNDCEDASPCLGIETTTFYHASTNPNDIARYFLPNGKTEIYIKEDLSDGTVPDVWAGWLAIAGRTGKFASTVAIKPRHQSFGIVINLHKNLDRICKNMWLLATLPFVQVQHDLHLTECCRQDAAQSYDDLPPESQFVQNSLNATQAFNHPLLRFAKMKNGVQKLAGLADIALNLGYTYKQNQTLIARLYGTFIAPMGYKPNPEYVFAPLIGNGRHFGIGAGIDLECELSCNDQRRVSIINHFAYHYLLRGVEKRTFDLISRGRWSRYTDVVDKNNKALGLQSASNFLTQEMFVTPKSVINNMLSLHMSSRTSQRYEVGYNFYHRSKEDIRLRHPLPSNVLLPDTPLIISQAATVLSTNTPLQTCDADLESATHPAVITHQFYIATGFATDIHDCPTDISVGASYEFGDQNVSLDLWGVFFKINIAL